jgi:N-acetylmuramoyl-L-alanine amidase
MSDAEIKAALTDLDVLWLTMWAEARNEPVQGQLAVGCVIRNRVRGKAWFGNTYAKACFKPWQFSCWNAGADTNHVRLMALAGSVARRQLYTVTPRIKQLKYLAAGVFFDELEDCTAGADHYLTTDRLLDDPPTWTKNQQPVSHIGAHTFFRLG